MDEARFRAAEAALWAHWGTTPVEHRVRAGAGGPLVRVLETGDADGPPLLYVHGATVAGSCWADLATALPTHRSLLLDRPGCGLSEPYTPPPGLAGLPALADRLVPDVLDALGVERAHLVSNSMGGLFALRAAAAAPERVASVTHFGWSLGAPVAALPLMMHLATSPLLGAVMARVPATAGTVRSMLRATGLTAAVDGGGIPEVGIRWNVALQNHTDTRVHDWRMAGGAGLRQQMDALALPPELLATVRAPVRIAYGTEDPFGTVATMQALADALPHGALDVWEGKGHAVWLDDLERARELVQDVVATAA